MHACILFNLYIIVMTNDYIKLVIVSIMISITFTCTDIDNIFMMYVILFSSSERFINNYYYNVINTHHKLHDDVIYIELYIAV